MLILFTLQLGDSKDAVRSNVRAILKQISFIFPSTKLFQYIMDGIKSKNSRQRSGFYLINL